MAKEFSLRLFAREKTAAEPLVFAGETSMLKADVWLHNEHHDELRLKRATIVCPEIQKQSTATEVARFSVPAVLPAQQRKLLSVSFDLDPATPPGTYDAKVQVETATSTLTFPAQIIVTQSYQLSLEPDEFVFTAEPGSHFSGELIVRNEGNVPVEVTPMGEHPLRDPQREECCPVGDKLETKEHGFGSLTITNETLRVEPGTWALVKFKVKVPSPLPANEHLRATPRVGNERFIIDIITPVEALERKRSSAPKRK